MIFQLRKPLNTNFQAYKLLPLIDPKTSLREEIVRENIKILEETFASFGIKVTVERAEIGPSVTKYEVKPAVGVRVNRISNLADDLALALAARMFESKHLSQGNPWSESKYPTLRLLLCPSANYGNNLKRKLKISWKFL